MPRPNLPPALLRHTLANRSRTVFVLSLTLGAMTALSAPTASPRGAPPIPLESIGVHKHPFLHGRIVHVDGEAGDDRRDGLTPENSVATIGRGAEIVRGGDVMLIAPGTYYEQPVFWNLGRSRERPVWIRALVPGTVTISAMWREAALGLAPWTDEGDGVYSSGHGAALFGSFEGTFLFRLNTVDDLRNQRAESVDLDLPRHGFAVEDERIYVRLPEDADPNGRSVLFSPPSWDEEGWIIAVVEISESPYVILDGLRIEGSGTSGVWIDGASDHPTIRNTILSYCVFALRLPDDSLVEWSEYVYPGFRDLAELLYEGNGGDAMAVYKLVKEYHETVRYEGGLASTEGASERPARDCEFRYNFLHETFDGEKLGSFESSESHHNVYQHNYDNDVEMEVWKDWGSKELRLHHSLMLGCPAGPVSHQESTLVGPQYVYRNVIYGYDDIGWKTWTLVKSNAPNATAGIFYYHNVMWGARTGLVYETRERFQFRNNIFVFSHNWDENVGTFDSDYNLLVNDEDKRWLYGDQGDYVGDDPADVEFVDVDALNFATRLDGPAENAGVALPGFNDDAPGGPDIGVFEVGEEPEGEWPRPRRTVFTQEPPERWIDRGR